MSTTKDFIVEQLKEQIANFKVAATRQTVGKVVEVSDGIARMTGLSDVMSSEMVPEKVCVNVPCVPGNTSSSFL